MFGITANTAGWRAAQDGKNLLKGWEAGRGDLAEQFLAGVVAHLPALQAFTTPTVLGYERLKPGDVSGSETLFPRTLERHTLTSAHK